MILVVDNDLIMVVGDPTRDYKSKSMGWKDQTHLKQEGSEFISRSSYPVAEIRQGSEFKPEKESINYCGSNI